LQIAERVATLLLDLRHTLLITLEPVVHRLE